MTVKVKQDSQVFDDDIAPLWAELRELGVVRDEVPAGIIGQLAQAARTKNTIESEMQNGLEEAYEAIDLVEELIEWLLLELSDIEIEIEMVAPWD